MHGPKALPRIEKHNNAAKYVVHSTQHTPPRQQAHSAAVASLKHTATLLCLQHSTQQALCSARLRLLITTTWQIQTACLKPSAMPQPLSQAAVKAAMIQSTICRGRAAPSTVSYGSGARKLCLQLHCMAAQLQHPLILTRQQHHPLNPQYQFCCSF